MSETVELEGHEWPFKRYGMMALDVHSEDGEWDGMATSENATGANLAWLDPIGVAILRPGEIVISREQLIHAFAQAYCEPINAHKEFDARIGEAMINRLFPTGAGEGE